MAITSTDNFSLYSSASAPISYKGPSTPDVSFDTYDASVLTLSETIDTPKPLYFRGDTIKFVLTISNSGTDTPEAYVKNSITAGRVKVTEYVIGNGTLQPSTDDLHDLVIHVPAITASGDTVITITGIVQ